MSKGGNFINEIAELLQVIPGVRFDVKQKDGDVEIILITESGKHSKRVRYLVCKNKRKDTYDVYGCGFILNHYGDCYDRNCDPMKIKKDKLFNFIEEEFLPYAEK